MVETNNTSLEANKEKTDMEADTSEETYWRIRPYHTADFDSETGEYNERIELPGVPKDHVRLRVLPELFDLRAKREHTEYILTEPFPYKMNVESIEANYEHGLLLIKGKFQDPMESAVEIKLS